MARLAFRFALLLVPVLFLISTAAPFTGQRLAPTALDSLGFAACKLPCWAGITPGLTPFAQADELLVEHLPNVDITLHLLSSALTFQVDNELSGILFYDGGHVSEIHLEVVMPINYFLETLGTPDCVTASKGPTEVSLSVIWETSDGFIGAFLLFDGRMGWNPALVTRSVLMGTVNVCDTPGILSWKGFAPAWHYAAQVSGLAVP
jgi:hypothetical protein